MKIVQLCGVIEGAGITRYLIEVNNALVLAGHNVVAFDFSETKQKEANQTLHNLIRYEFTEEQLNIINSSDLVFVHQLLPKKMSDEYREQFENLIKNQITTKKILFLNDHSSTMTGFSKFYGSNVFTDLEFLNSFDKFCIHCDTNTYATKLKNILGEEEFYKRYVNMHHPHHFDDNVIDTWRNLNEKHRRITYIGRWHTIKHPEQMINMHKYMQGDWEFEMRGIVRLIGLIYTPDLFYEIDPNPELKGTKECIIGPSKRTFTPSKEWRLQNNYTKDDLLIDVPHGDKIWIFGEYKREDGMLAISKSAFGGEFYHLPDSTFYGNNLEYAMHEIIEHGTIPIFDTHAMKSIKYFENGRPTDKSLYDMNICICLNSDLSNIEEVKEKIEQLYNDQDAYNDMRNRAYKVIKNHCDPIATANTLIEDCLK